MNEALSAAAQIQEAPNLGCGPGSSSVAAEAASTAAAGVSVVRSCHAALTHECDQVAMNGEGDTLPDGSAVVSENSNESATSASAKALLATRRHCNAGSAATDVVLPQQQLLRRQQQNRASMTMCEH